MTEPIQVLGLTADQIQAGGAYWTAREIAQQPKLWPEIGRLVAADTLLAGFLPPLLTDPRLGVVLAGAGTSSFVGDCLAPSLLRKAGQRVAAISSTDIVASPENSLATTDPTLMVHFSRSGDSPESVAAMEFAEERIECCAHLVVTCNAAGALYQRTPTMRRAHAVLLPEACNDQSFAMTSSFTGMLLAAAIALRVFPQDDLRVARLARIGASVMTSCLPLLTDLVRARFERVVYLGSNELKGLARESALKMLELTDGRVVTMADTPLGFRHGPKTIVNDTTLVVLFLSNDLYTRLYDLDLLAELRRDGVAGRVIALATRPDVPQHTDTLVLGESAVSDRAAAAAAAPMLTDLELCLPYVVFAQSLALLRSLSLGLSPDNPNSAGTVSRVVRGVSIHNRGRMR
jgi:tagatose-6-phosphate ketose/aldose isomerase